MKRFNKNIITFIIIFIIVVMGLWAAAEIPLPEHPRPDWERAQWMNLNGNWKFAFDKSDAGVMEIWFAAGDEKFG